MEAERDFIQRLQAEKSEKYQDAEFQQSLQFYQQLFPEHWIYLVELLQNAVDEGATNIALRHGPEPHSLIFEHNGNPFTERNVATLCSSCMSDKGLDKVGFMGIGFKSVFTRFQRVIVLSGGWRFALDGPWSGNTGRPEWYRTLIPRWVEVPEAQLPPDGYRCRFILLDPRDAEHSTEEDAQLALRPDQLPMLARSGVQRLDWLSDAWDLSCKADSRAGRRGDPEVWILSATEGQQSRPRQWVLFSTTIQPTAGNIKLVLGHRNLSADQHDRVRREATTFRVEAFVGLDQDGVPEPDGDGKAYSLLPTSEALPFGLNVQATWLLVSDRQDFKRAGNNAWFRQIASAIPALLAAYLRWSVALEGLAPYRVPQILKALPNLGAVGGHPNEWMLGGSFNAQIKEALQDTACLPALRPDGAVYLTPRAAALIPKELASLDCGAYRSWQLFGDSAASRQLLGEAFRFFDSLGLTRNLEPRDLTKHWHDGLVGRWFEELGKRGNEALLHLLEGLGRLDEDPAWQEAPLCCLKNEAGTWCHRGALKHQLPGDWSALPNENWLKMRGQLLPLVGDEEQLLSWTLQLQVRKKPEAKKYIEVIEQRELSELVDLWWEEQEQFPNSEQSRQVVAFTSWVRAKAPNRPGLVGKVLCEAPGPRLQLVPWDKAVLDYASKHRRRFFVGALFVSTCYRQLHPPALAGADNAAWKTFFESAGVKRGLRGRFELQPHVQEVTADEARSIHPGADLPAVWPRDIRQDSSNPEIQRLTFSTVNYGLVDERLPEGLEQVLAGPVSPEAFEDISEWLAGNPERFRKAALRQRLRYVPNGSDRGISNLNLAEPAGWLKQLRDTPWVYADDGSGPHVPAEVGMPRAAQAGMGRIARLPQQVAQALSEREVTFGRDQVRVIASVCSDGPHSPITIAAPEISAVLDYERRWDRTAERLPGSDNLLVSTPRPDTTDVESTTRVILVRQLEKPWTNEADLPLSLDELRGLERCLHQESVRGAGQTIDPWVYLVAPAKDEDTLNVLPMPSPLSYADILLLRNQEWRHRIMRSTEDLHIGIVTDTHDREEMVLDAIEAFDRAGCQHVIHCGDIEKPEILQLFDSLANATLWWVNGKGHDNTDDLLLVSDRIGARCMSPDGSGFGRADINGYRFGVCHDSSQTSQFFRERLVNTWSMQDFYDYVLYGHFHYFNLCWPPPTRRTAIINVGGFYRPDWLCTFGILHPVERQLDLYFRTQASGFSRCVTFDLQQGSWRLSPSCKSEFLDLVRREYELPSSMFWKENDKIAPDGGQWLDLDALLDV